MTIGETWCDMGNNPLIFILNGLLDSTGIINSGEVAYNTIRFYNKGLTASEVLRNYQHTLSYMKLDKDSKYH
jgi:hypothetical protein